MSTELCYKLNIPPFIDMVRDDWKENLIIESPKKRNFNSIKIPIVSPANLAIKEEYLNFNNVEWKNIVYLSLDSGIVTHIHSDNSGDSIDPNLENPKFIWFAINFVVSGSGRMDYYLPSQLDPDSFSDPTDPYHQKNWTTKQQPYKSYEMTTGAYLLNATIPHKATAHEKRLVISLRPNFSGEQGAKLWGKSWDNIVKMFDNYIIK
jgi:hypothetical protein